MSKSTYTFLHDPQGLIEAELPLDRAPYEALVTAVLTWTTPSLAASDYQQIALQLTGHARAVGTAIHHYTLRYADRGHALADDVLHETNQQLAAPLEGTAACAQGRARLVKMLYEQLDRLTEPLQR